MRSRNVVSLSGTGKLITADAMASQEWLSRVLVRASERNEQGDELDSIEFTISIAQAQQLAERLVAAATEAKIKWQ